MIDANSISIWILAFLIGGCFGWLAAVGTMHKMFVRWTLYKLARIENNIEFLASCIDKKLPH